MAEARRGEESRGYYAKRKTFVPERTDFPLALFKIL